ncbi:MAG: anti-sigma factor [Flavobacteriales bacterium]|nr:anti-sigma factor [Flavobacteriales bacterium]
MDCKEYIASGIIERYVIGAVSDQERREVECMSSIYPELKDELHAAQSTIESYMESIAVEPPAGLKQSILESIKNIEQDPSETKGKIVSMKPDKAESDQPKIVEMKPKSRLNWAVAAAVVPLIGLGIMYFGERNSRIEANNQLAKVEAETAKQFEDSLTGLRETLAQNEAYQELILDESTQEVLLAGTDLSPESQARVFWSDAKKQFMLVSDRLPAPVSSKQYQLWAIADGVPVDLGVLDKQSTIVSPKEIDLENIQAFAITLEKNGGSVKPTLDQMYVVGTI